MSPRQLVRELRSALSKKNMGEAKRLFIHGIDKCEDEFLPEVKRQGCFRSSKDDFEIESIRKLVSFALNEQKTRLSESSIQYLESVKAILHISASVRQLYFKMLHEIKYCPPRLKEMLAGVELYWLNRWANASGEDAYSIDAPLHMPEDLAECFSFYAYHVAQIRPLKDEHLGAFDESRLISGKNFDSLLNIRPIIELQRAEILIDHFGYTATRDKSRVDLRPPSDEFEQAMRFGYASGEIAEQNLASNVLKSFQEAASLSSVAKRIFESERSTLVRKAENPERLVVVLPDTKEFRKVILHDGLFREEVQSVASATKELLIGHENLFTTPVYKSVTLGDILRYQRIFYFIMAGLSAYLKNNQDTKLSIIVRSLIPVMNVSQLTEYGKLCVGREKGLEICELLSWKVTDKGVFDVQYQPIIKAEKLYMIPLHIIAQSNLLRNVLCVSKFRFDSESHVDPVTDMLEEALESQGFLVSKNHHYALGEVDILAMKDGCLFAFECKSSVRPAGVAELRTSFDYMEKGVEQLSRFRAAAQEPGFLASLLRALKWGGVTDERIITCIVMGNRMFAGLTHKDHPVRPLFSLVSFIKTGELAFCDRVERLWLTDKFSAEDLRRYVEDNIMHRGLMQYMKPYTFSYSVVGKCLNVHTCLLDASALLPKNESPSEELVSDGL